MEQLTKGYNLSIVCVFLWSIFLLLEGNVISGTLTPNGTVSLDCGSQKTFNCNVTGPAAVWIISGLSEISVTGTSGLLAANSNPRITTTDTSGVTPSSTITITGFTTADDGGTIQCINLADSRVQGMASISAVALTVQFQSSELNVSEAIGTVEVTVIANATCGFNYSVDITTSDITTGSNDHNLTINKQLEFPAGSTSASVVIAIDDDVYENTESFQITITSISDADILIGMNNETTINIEDDELITVFFQEDPFTFLESDGEAVVPVYADLPPGGLAVDITLGVIITNATATSPADYDASLTSVILYATNTNMTTEDLRINIVDEDILENDEVFDIVLSTSSSRLAISNSTSVIIVNDESLTVEFQLGELNVSEAMGTVEVLVIANGTSEFDYTVNLTISDITTDSNDYNATVSMLLEFPAGGTSASVVIAVTDDDVYENTESFQLAIASTSDGNVLIGVNNETTINIEDDEIITVFFQENSYIFSESDGAAVVTVYAHIPRGIMYVSAKAIFTNGTAISPGDYDASAMSFFFMRHNNMTESIASVNLTIAIMADEILETDEEFTIMLNSSQERVVIANSTSIIIQNDDAIEVELNNVEYNVSESEGTVMISLMANGTSEFDYNVTFTLMEYSTESDDHNVTGPTSLEFPAGCTSASVVIAIDDDVYENIESFQLAITSTSDANVLIGMNNKTVVNIEDDELITVFFLEDPFSFLESESEAVVTVYADLPSGGLAVNITLGVNITNGTAISPADYDDSLMYVMVLATTSSMTTAELRITIEDEGSVERDENFTIMLTTTETRVNIVNSTSVVILNDDDVCLVEVTDCGNNTNITWPKTEIGHVASVRCPCGPEDENPLPPKSVATRRCLRDNDTRARWEDPVCTECRFGSGRTLCQLLQDDSPAQVASILANVTKETDSIRSEDITIASVLLDRVANSTDIQANPMVLSDFFVAVDNIANIREDELRLSNENSGSVNRITSSFDRVLEAISLPENNSGNASIVLTFNNFAIQIQQLPRDNTSFTPNLSELIMGIRDISNSTLRENVSTTGSVTLPPELTAFQSVAFAVFLRTSLYPPSNDNSSVGSIIIAVSIQNQTVDNLREPVKFRFEKNEVARMMDNSINFSCSFWDNEIDKGRGDWSSRGCVVVNETADAVICQCDHLTSFSILLDILPDHETPSQPIDTILTVVSYIGSGLSVIALIIALVSYIAERNLHQNLHQKLLISLMFALLGLYVIFIITNAVSSYQDHLRTIPVICGILSALLHYFFIVTFVCMAAIAINLYRALVVVFNAEIKGYLPIAVSISWVVPVFIVGFSIAPNSQYYTGEIVPYCRAQGWPFYFGVIVPFGLIYIFNIAIFIIIITSLIRRTNVPNNMAEGNKHKKLKENFWITVGLTILFGVSWVFGMLATAGLPREIRLPFDIVFTVLASLQGVFVFLFYCVRSSECRQLWKNWILRRFTKKSQLRTSTTVSQHTSSTVNTSTGTQQHLTGTNLSKKQNGRNNSTLPPTDTTTSQIEPALELERRGTIRSGSFNDDFTQRITFDEDSSNERKWTPNENEDI